ncbi:MAG: ABC transporter substrate-binding protein [Deltaproteobacteria bacterium]|nr:ABC transporter substrate-binding protein [Deltaproteobacteria bacterium]
MKSLPTLLLCIMTIGSSIVCNAEQPAIKIGALYNITGDMAPIDLPASRGSRLAAKRIDEKGGLLDGKTLELIVVDTKTDMKEASKAAEQLVSMGVAAGLGYGDTDSVLAAGPVFQQHGIPFLTSGATDPFLPEEIGPCLFMVSFGDDDQARAMAEFAYATLGTRNAAIWTNGSSRFTKILSKFFKERYRSLGGNVLEDRSFDAGQTDFSAFIQSLKKSSPRPDVLFISGLPSDAVPTVGQVRKAGIRLPILSGDGFDADLIERLPQPEEADGVYFSTHDYRGSNRPEVTAFVDAYEKEYGKAPENAFAALGYDAVNLLADAVNRAKTTEPKAVAKALAETHDFKAVTGEISFTRPGRAPVAIIGIPNGTYRLMKTWTGGNHTLPRRDPATK